MTKEVGLWIDHREAVIVSIVSEGEEIKRIRSDVDSQNTPGGISEDRRDRRIEGDLNQFYDEVIQVIRNADSILILGPGEAKGQLEKRLEHENLSDRVVGVESADSLTEPQIAARVRDYFQK